VRVDGHVLSLTNLSKVLYPAAGFTKGAVVDYYASVAPVLLPHLAERPLTVTRWPDGVEGGTFFAKNAPAGTPPWVRRVRLPAPGSSAGRLDYVVVDGVATLVWLANLAALELHVPQWRVAGDPPTVGLADRLVLDLDPGAPADVLDCAALALAVLPRLRAAGLDPVVCSSGSKGLQVYARLAPTGSAEVSAWAHALARDLERERPDEVVSVMAKAARVGKVFLDWSQNTAAKTTISPYSLRARTLPAVAAPLTEDELAGARRPQDLRVAPQELRARLDRHGDLAAPLLTGPAGTLPSAGPTRG
jgi:bifunctional non-homologous end joining protein LigD